MLVSAGRKVKKFNQYFEGLQLYSNQFGALIANFVKIIIRNWMGVSLIIIVSYLNCSVARFTSYAVQLFHWKIHMTNPI